MIRTLLLFSIFASGAYAQNVTTDAFGVLPSTELESRADWAGYRVTSGGEVVMQSAQNADAALLFVGPKSIVAGVEPGHAVTLVLDAFGNMLEGVSTEYELGFGDTIEVETRLGIASHLFRPPPASGQFLAGAAISGIQSARADYRVTANLSTVQPEWLPNSESILQETFGQITTTSLGDVHGNMVDDGVGLSVVLTHNEGRSSFLQSVVRDGAAHATLLARDIGGSVSGQLALAGRQSNSIALNIETLVMTDVGDLAIWSAPEINAIRVQIGPLQTERGYLVPDGTPAQVAIVGQTGRSASAISWVLDGHLVFTLPLSSEAAPFDLALTVAENTHRANVALTGAPMHDAVRGAE